MLRADTLDELNSILADIRRRLTESLGEPG
jgi:hypothetical protein